MDKSYKFVDKINEIFLTNFFTVLRNSTLYPHNLGERIYHAIKFRQ
ncbi:MAG: hypothetical protein LBT09_00025 [Planctomycetaceae bacterium]|nr:hypothetical protein [Planctomycetaceae bacterium]